MKKPDLVFLNEENRGKIEKLIDPMVLEAKDKELAAHKAKMDSLTIAPPKENVNADSNDAKSATA